MTVQEVSKVGGGQVVEGCVDDEENFELDLLLNGEPVEFWMYCGLLRILVDVPFGMLFQKQQWVVR